MTMFGSQWLANAGSTYEIEQSIRFNDGDSPYLARTPGAAGTEETWTYSAWIKRGILSSSMSLFEVRVDGNSYGFMRLEAADSLFISFNDGATAFGSLRTTQLFRDPSAWYHIILVADTGNGTAGNRLRLYVNGERVTSFSTESYPTLNSTLYGINWALEHRIGDSPTFANHFDGYMAEINFVDGTAVDPSSFGETNSATGQWVPKKYTGAYGTNGFFIDGRDSSDLGDDESGNGNDFTSSGLAANDQVSDSPTNNWCIMNSLAYDSTQITLTDGNLTLAWNTPNGDGGTTALSTFDISQHGKSYWEFSAANSSVNYSVGVCTNTSVWRKPRTQSAFAELRYGVQNASTAEMQVTSGDGSIDSTGVLATTGSEVGMMAFDPASGKLWVGQDGTFFNSGDPAGGSDEQGTFTGDNNTGIYVNVRDYSSAEVGAVTFNFGQSDFAHTPPTGFTALNTDNLPDPATADPSAYFQTTLYEGDGSTQSIDQDGNSTFSPNFVWIKNRDATDAHALFDTVRGATEVLSSNSTAAEATNADTLTAFESDGFALGDDVIVNTNAESYVAWQWNEGATSGFDIVSYTGNATARTISHSAGVVPKMIIVKNLADTDNWAVYHAGNTAAPATDYLVLNSNANTVDDATVWNDTAPTSSVFSVGTSSLTNGNTEAMIAYVFADVEGFSKFGSYVGNNSTNGPMVNVGFRPAFIMIKSTDVAVGSWILFDTKRDTYNAAFHVIYGQLSNVEDTAHAYGDILSNGFKVRKPDGFAINDAGATYVYAAFAESPFKTANAR